MTSDIAVRDEKAGTASVGILSMKSFLEEGHSRNHIRILRELKAESGRPSNLDSGTMNV